VERSLAWTVDRFDRFFADERETDEERPGSFVRWRNDLRLGTDTVATYGTGLRADLDVPALSRRLERLRLTVTGDTVEPLDTLATGDAAPATPGPFSAGLRYLARPFLRARPDLSAGLLLQLPVGLFVRLRLRWTVPVVELLVARLATSGFWQTTTGWGARQDAVLERPLGGHALLRLASFATLTERSRGLEWRSELAAIEALGPRAAVAALGSAEGASDLGAVVETWRVALRVRRDVLRRWLFLEVEPALSWPLDATGRRTFVESVTFRLEVQFGERGGSTAAPTPTVPPAEPGPAAPLPPPETAR
jgi:hypothetical protein